MSSGNKFDAERKRQVNGDRMKVKMTLKKLFYVFFFWQYLHNNMNIDTRAKNVNKNSLSVFLESTSLENWLY